VPVAASRPWVAGVPFPLRSATAATARLSTGDVSLGAVLPL